MITYCIIKNNNYNNILYTITINNYKIIYINYNNILMFVSAVQHQKWC